jgi:hypothetical protein
MTSPECLKRVIHWQCIPTVESAKDIFHITAPHSATGDRKGSDSL